MTTIQKIKTDIVLWIGCSMLGFGLLLILALLASLVLRDSGVGSGMQFGSLTINSGTPGGSLLLGISGGVLIALGSWLAFSNRVRSALR